MLNTVDMADIYFSTNYFGAEDWAKLSSEQKTLLIETAENDVSAALGVALDPAVCVHTEPPYTPIQKAVFEWALYMHKYKATLTKLVNASMSSIASVEVEGIGKETYVNQRKSNSNAYIACLMASRAGQFLSLIQRDTRITR